MKKTFFSSIFLLLSFSLFGYYNQTLETTPVLPPTDLPFDVSIDLMQLSLPNGWHSGAVGQSGHKCLLVAGRTNGLHGFDNNPLVNNFPPRAQNTVLYVIDFKKQEVWQRPLNDPSSGLTQTQIDTLSVTSPQYHQGGDTLYITGGYGIDTATGQMGTKSTLTAIDVPGLIKWVMQSRKKDTACKHIRQTSNPLLQVTGGYMSQVSPHLPMLLIFGQNFTGLYRDGSNGAYTQQVRTFNILDNGTDLYVVASDNQPAQDPSYRRRDLNVVPVVLSEKGKTQQAYVALSGVFTLSSGIWTVPVTIYPDGSSFMPDPHDPTTFKQGMNNYACPTAGLFSDKSKDMYVIIFGGITYGFFENGVFDTDSEIPFTNEVTTVKIDKHSVYSQYIMGAQYPTIYSTFSNPGNVLLFGAGAAFIRADGLARFPNHVIEYDRLSNKPTVIGYIVGGIQSTLPNTNTNSDSGASPYIFQVTLLPK